MAWSDQARRAALEARKRKRVTVTSAHGAKVKVPRSLYAQKIRLARKNIREMRKDYKDMQSHSIAHVNRTARSHGGVWAAAAQRKTTRDIKKTRASVKSWAKKHDYGRRL